MASGNSRCLSGLSFNLKKCSLQQPPFHGFDQLPWDVFAHILCLLPIKFLIQCKCVSKAWLRLINYVCVPRISSTLPLIDGFICRAKDSASYWGKKTSFIDYVSLHDPNNLEEASANPNMFEVSETVRRSVGRYSALLPFDPSPDDLLDVCRGLLLFVSWCLTSGPQYYVCNPTTKQCVRIPKGSVDMEENCYASLAFDPSESPHYQVVRFPRTPVKNSAPMCRTLDVFSSETGMWVRHKILFQPLDAFDDDDERYMTRRTCYLDGVLYRLSWSHHLVSFNLRMMTRHAIDLPWKYVTDVNRFIGVCKERLHYANNDKSRILIWVLSDTAKSCDDADDAWILKHSIAFGSSILSFPLNAHKDPFKILFDNNYKVFAIHPTSDIVYITNSFALFSHHFGSNELCKFCSWGDDPRRILNMDQKYWFPYSICYVALKDLDKTVG